MEKNDKHEETEKIEMKKGNNSRNELQKYIYITGYTRLCDKSVCLYEKDIKNNDNK